MASQAQIEANRRNAQRSTGPRTPLGKQRASLNALAHGLRAARVVAAAEDAGLFDALRRQVVAEWRPGSVLEVLLAERLAELAWRLRRVAGVEVELIERSVKPRPAGLPEAFFDADAALTRDLRAAQPVMLRVQLYQMRLERGLHRTLAELRRLQLDRQLQDERAHEPADDAGADDEGADDAGADDAGALDAGALDAGALDAPVATDVTRADAGPANENGRTNPIGGGPIGGRS